MNIGKLFKQDGGAVSGIVDRLALTSTEKRQLEMELLMALYQHTEKEIMLRAEIMAKELSGNWLQRSWRPIVMLAFAAVVVAGAFMDIPMLREGSEFWELLQIGIGGYVVGRSMEGVSEMVLKKRKAR
ncbi:MAG: 3TM-type holin [Marinifilaceae bacterium]